MAINSKTNAVIATLVSNLIGATCRRWSVGHLVFGAGQPHGQNGIQHGGYDATTNAIARCPKVADATPRNPRKRGRRGDAESHDWSNSSDRTSEDMEPKKTDKNEQNDPAAKRPPRTNAIPVPRAYTEKTEDPKDHVDQPEPNVSAHDVSPPPSTRSGAGPAPTSSTNVAYEQSPQGGTGSSSCGHSHEIRSMVVGPVCPRSHTNQANGMALEAFGPSQPRRCIIGSRFLNT